MDFTLANRVQLVKPSPTLAVAATAAKLKAEGHDIIGLGTGEPDFDTPDNIKRAAVAALEAGFTKYTPVDGFVDLKQAVIDKFKRDNQLDFELDEVIVSVGGKQSCYNLCQAWLNDGDEVIIPAPYWVSYPDMVLLAGGKPVIVQADADARFKITPDQLEKAITPKTKMMFFNSPSNPSGVAYTAEELKGLAEVLLRHPQVLVATDDMYEHIIWSQPFVNILNVCPELKERTVVLNGVSKAYSMTGWRIGYTAGPAPIIKAMKKIQSQSTSNPCSIAQKAALEALNGPQDSVAMMVKAFKERHDFLTGKLSTIEGVQVVPSDGTFYSFPSVQQVIEAKGMKDDLVFAEQLLKEQGIALVPGSAFGSPGCIRLSFATSMENLQKACDRLAEFCKA